MDFTGKCESDYNDWFYEKFLSDTKLPNDAFKYINSTMEYSIKVDFLFTKGIEVSVTAVSYDITFPNNDKSVYGFFPNRDFHNSRTVAIKKANDIYNKQ